MATLRSIYLSTEDDLKLYNQAKEKASKEGKSTSIYILEAIRYYMDNDYSYSLYVLYVGKSGNMEKKKFYGFHLGTEWGVIDNKKYENQLYLTKRNQILYYQRFIDKDGEESANIKLFSSLEEITNVGENLIKIAKEKLDIKESDFLDI